MRKEIPFRIRNARVLSKRPKLVDIVVNAGRISAIEPASPHAKTDESRDFDAHGKLVLPGLIDCHAHLFELAMQEETVQLNGSRSIGEMQGRIRSYLIRRDQGPTLGNWVVGRGWDQDLFIERRLPSRHDLDVAVSNLPAIMLRVCGHMAVLNTLALKILSRKGVLESFGKELIPVEQNGKPIGIMKETALEASRKAIPGLRANELQDLFVRSQKLCLEHGLTGVHCILSEDWKRELTCIRELDRRKMIIVRLSVLLPVEALRFVEQLRQGSRARFLRGKRFEVIGFKIYSDGSLGARTAALEEPYSDENGNRGLLNYSDSKLFQIVRRVRRLKLVLASHAIGDRAVAQVLRTYRTAGIRLKDGFRIEHCSVLRKDIVNQVRIATVSVQPMFLESDYWISERIGRTKARFAYPFKTLHQLTTMIGGSDAPVETLNPLFGISAAMKNRNRRESLTLHESIELYTINAARSSPITERCGAIAKGKNCDLVVLNCRSPNRIRNARVIATFVDGNISN